MKADIKKLPARQEVKQQDTWDLASLFPDDDAWEKAFRSWEKQLFKFAKFQGTLKQSAANLAACLKFDSKFDREADRLSTYAFLKTTEDTANSDYQRMIGRFRHVATLAAQAASYIRPEILAIPSATLREFVEQPVLARFRIRLERLLRYKPHTLGKKEENLLAMQGEMAQTASQVFRQLNDADLKFGAIRNEKGETIELSTATFSSLLHAPDRKVRKNAFHQFYEQYAGHENTLAATLAGSIQRDVYYAKARNFKAPLCGPVRRQRARRGVRQPDRGGPPPSAGPVSLLRSAAPQDEAPRHPPLRYVCPHPQRPRNQAHLGPGGRQDHRRPGSAGERVLQRAQGRPRRPLVRPISQPRQAERRL